VRVPVRDSDGRVTLPQDLAATASGSTCVPNVEDIEALLQGTQNNDTAALRMALVRWCDAIASQYAVPVHDLTTCLADGRALCLLVHYYHPTVLPTAAIKNTTASLLQKLTSDAFSSTAASVALDSFVEATSLAGGALNKADVKKGIEGERKNFTTLRRACHAIGGVPLMLPIYDSSNLPEEKTMTIFLGFLFARLIESSTQVRAAIRIQRFMRRVQPVIQVLASQRCADAVKRRNNKTSMVPVRSKKQPATVAAAAAAAVVDVPVIVTVSASHAASTIQRRVRVFLQSRRYSRTLQAWKARLREVEEESARLRAQELQARQAREEAERERARLAAEEEAALLRAAAEEEEARLRAEEDERIRQEEAAQLLRLAAAAEDERVRQEAEAADMIRVLEEAAEAIRLREVEEDRVRRDEDAAAYRRQQQEEIQRLREEADRLRQEQEAAAQMRLEAEEHARIAAAEEAERVRVEAERLVHEAALAKAAAEAEAERLRLEKAEAERVAQEEVARIYAEKEAVRAAAAEEERMRQEARIAVIEDERRRQEELAAEALQRLDDEARRHQEDLALAEESRLREAEASMLRIKEEQERLLIEARRKASEEARAEIEAEMVAGLERKLHDEEAARARAEAEVRAAQSMRAELEQRLSEEEHARREQENALVIEREAQAAADRAARVVLEARLEAEAQARAVAEAKLCEIEVAKAAAAAEAARRADEERAREVTRERAAVRLQATWRSKVAQWSLVRTLYGIILLQARVRGLVARHVLLLERQRAARLRIERRAADSMAAWWRGQRARRAFVAAVVQVVAAQREAAAREAVEAAELRRLEAEELARIAAAEEAESERQQLADAERAAMEAAQVQAAAATVIARWFRALRPMLRCRKLYRGWRRLQAVVRAVHVRETNKTKVSAALKRIKAAEQKALADPSLRIGRQTQSALQTLQSCSGKMISALLKACQTLEFSTQLSHRCSRAFAEAGASKVLFALIRSCNRSTPHQELLKHALVVLLHVARHHDLAPAVAASSAAEAADTLVDLMQMFRDKKPIFGKASELLCRLIAANKDIKSTCASADYRKRLDGILHIVERKHRLEAKVAKIQTNASARNSLSFSMSFAFGSGVPSLLDETMDEDPVGKAKGVSGDGKKRDRRVLAEEEPIDCIQQIMKMLT